MKRTIEKVFNNDKGKTEKASIILDAISIKDDYVILRRAIRDRNKENNPLYKCAECFTNLELSCKPDNKGDHTFYFRHFKDPGHDKCSIKSNSNLSREEINKRNYLLTKESNAHLKLKRQVGKIISVFHDKDVIIDTKFIKDRFGDSERRKPDIFFTFENKEITLEFQINNTFQSVIQDRELFYERNKISLIWIFNEFETDTFQSISIKDIYIPNKNNAFIFDEETNLLSHEREELVLKVYYKKFFLNDDDIDFEWCNEFVSLNQLKYDRESLRPYFFNSNKSKEDAQNELSLKKREEKAAKTIDELASDLLNFLSEFKKNDSLDTRHDYYLNYLEKLNDDERLYLNSKLGLNQMFNNSNNIIQALLFPDSWHINLIRFLLKTKPLSIPIRSINNNKQTTFISLMERFPNLGDIFQLLFSRNYKMNDLDEKYLKSILSEKKHQDKLLLYETYSKLANIDQMQFFKSNMYEFLVIESAKYHTPVIIGGEKQGILWLANLAANQYQKYWYYFDYAFNHYGTYNTIFKKDIKKSFLKIKNQLKLKNHHRHPLFEEVLFIIYPELKHK